MQRTPSLLLIIALSFVAACGGSRATSPRRTNYVAPDGNAYPASHPIRLMDSGAIIEPNDPNALGLHPSLCYDTTAHAQGDAGKPLPILRSEPNFDTGSTSVSTDDGSGPRGSLVALVALASLALAVCGCLGAYIARAKGRSALEGLLFGVLLGPIGVLIAVLMPTLPSTRFPHSGS